MRQTENRHDRIADELLGPAAEGQQLLSRRAEELPEDLARPLGIQPAAEARRVDDVGKQDGHHLPFLGADKRPDGRAAVGAEPGAAWKGAAADLASHHHTSRICWSTVNASKTDLLSRVPLFSQLSKRELDFVASRCDEVDSPAGQVLTTQGRLGDSFYVLLDGEADVKIDDAPRRVLKTGDFFGEISMLDRGLATATVTTTTDARLLVMSHAQFRDAIKSSDGLLVKVLAAMGERLRADMAAKGRARS
jgi:hypothetical protein